MFIGAQQLRKSVLNEIKIHCSLKHENIVTFHESFHDTNSVFIIQKLCAQGTLHDLLDRTPGYTLDTNTCKYYLKHILNGLKYLHENHIIHRDLKPSNILLDSYLRAMIGDFGLAMRCDSDEPVFQPICGTLSYLPPEVVGQKLVTFKSDVWAVGVIAYLSRFGVKPFIGRNNRHTISLILDGACK